LGPGITRVSQRWNLFFKFYKIKKHPFASNKKNNIEWTVFGRATLNQLQIRGQSRTSTYLLFRAHEFFERLFDKFVITLLAHFLEQNLMLVPDWILRCFLRHSILFRRTEWSESPNLSSGWTDRQRWTSDWRFRCCRPEIPFRFIFQNNGYKVHDILDFILLV